MNRKKFKCYACNEHNNFFEQNNKIGNCCKYCGTYNYYIIKKNKSNYNKNNNRDIDQSIGDNNEIMLDNSSLNNIEIINNNNQEKFYDEDTPLLSSNNQNNIYNNNDYINTHSNEIILYYNNYYNLDEENLLLKKDYLIKYDWLSKIKVTEDIINKCGKDFVCSICYEKLKDKDYIHITKCNHIFHYYCIEKAIDNNINECPLCRCNLKTGEKKITNNMRNDFINIIQNDNEYVILNNNNENNLENNNIYYMENNIQNNVQLKFNFDLIFNNIFCKTTKNCFYWLYKILILLIFSLFKVIKGCINRLFCFNKITFFKAIYFIFSLVLISLIIYLILFIISLVK